MTSSGIFGILVLVGFIFISLRHFRKSWKAFSDLDYKTSVTSGVISWAYPVGMILLTDLSQSDYFENTNNILCEF